MIYNPTDDYFYLNGVKTIYRGYQNAIAIFENGVFNVDIYNGVYKGRAVQTLEGGFAIENNVVKCTLPSTGSSGSTKVRTLFTHAIDATNYDYVKIQSNKGETVLNISALSGTVYIGFQTYNNGTNPASTSAYVVSELQNYADNNYILADSVIDSTATLVSISEITVE